MHGGFATAWLLASSMKNKVNVSLFFIFNEHEAGEGKLQLLRAWMEKSK